MDFEGPECPLTSKNALTATQNSGEVQKKIDKEISLGRIDGPFQQPPFANLKSSPLSLREKSTPGKFRLLHNLSYPYDSRSVNHNISKADSTVQYASITDAIKLVQQHSPNAFMAKTDISDAYRLIPLHKSQYHLTGLEWNGKYYFDKCLPMGCSSSCKIFERFSSGLEWILKNKMGITSLVKILDDFLFVESSDATCRKNLYTFIALCEFLGVPIAHDKTAGPSTDLVFLGIKLDSALMVASLPEDKLTRYSNDITSVLNSKSVNLNTMKSTIGKLQFATSVVTSGKPFLRRLHDTTMNVKKTYHMIRISKPVRADLHVWSNFLQHYNGKTFIHFSPEVQSRSIHMYTDASFWGFGGTYGTHWIQGQWPPSWKTYDIVVLELYPIFLLVTTIAHKLTNSQVCFHCDNSAVVCVLNKQTSKKPELMAILHPLILVLLKHNIRFRAEHIPGKENNLCDLLSRTQDIQDALKRYGMLPTSTLIAPHLLPENFPLIWGKILESSMQPSTQLQYLRQWNIFVDFCHTVIGQYNLSLIRSNHVALFVAHLSERQLSYKTIHTYLSLQSRMYSG